MAWQKTYSGEEPIRVNKWLAQQGACSRREADDLIAQGLVFLDDVKIADAGRKILPGQTLRLAGGAAANLEAQITVVLHKPVGYVSAQPERNQIPAARLIGKDTLWGEAKTIPDSRASLPPLGRLDQDSRGLLILSQDGALAKAIIGPQSAMDKEYLVEVRGPIDEKKLALLRHGLALDGRQLKPAKVASLGGQRLRFILQEGRNRQIRRMCREVGLDVTDLFRVRIGPLELGDLPEGRWRMLSRAERDALIKP